MAIAATFPRQASNPNASCVALGRRLQLRGHEIRDVVGEALGADTIDIPPPSVRVRIEGDQAVFRQRRDKLNHEERIAGGLLEHQFGERLHMLRLRTEGVGDEPPRRRQAREASSTISWTFAPALRIRSNVRTAGERDRLHCRDRRRPAGDAARPGRRPGAQAVRASPRPAIADRRGTAREGAPAGRTRRGSAGTPSGTDSAPPAAEDRDRRLLADDERQARESD